MQTERFDELTERSAKSLSNTPEALARDAVLIELEAMKAEDKILMLSAEEERLLRAFRAFKPAAKPGSVFKWQTHPETSSELVVATDTGLIRDPQEV